MLTESEIKAYTVGIPNDIQAAQRASGCASVNGSASPRRFATSVVLCKRLDGWNNDIQMRLGYYDSENADEAKGRAVTDAMTNNPGYSMLMVGTFDVTQNAELCDRAAEKQKP